MKPLQRCALVGLPLGFALNLVALFVFHRHSSVFFTPAWWTTWYPNYLVWATLGFVGSVVRERTEETC